MIYRKLGIGVYKCRILLVVIALVYCNSHSVRKLLFNVIDAMEMLEGDSITVYEG